ncbi:MAG: hypothetical protein WC705_00015 [Candidatus Paceibacterota bacterium]|jgi:hypothetical protein
MKKAKIILSVSIFLITGFSGIVNAAESSLYVSPINLTKSIGDVFDVSIGIRTSGNKVCAVEGTLILNNLSCQNMTLSGDVTPQTSPTCSNPHFLIGIPSCTIVDKTLFTASIKGTATGASSVGFTGVDIIGEGISLGSVSTVGNYTINPILTVTPTPISIPTPKSEPLSKPIEEPKTEPVTPEIAQQSTEVIEVTASEGPNPFLATISSFITLGTGNNIIGIIILFAIVLAIYLIPSYFERRKKIK